MSHDNYECIHRIKYAHRKGHTRKDPDTRAMLSERFKTMYRQLGLDRTEAAKFLRVSERTLHNWESGKHEIPYSAYKLLRLQTYQELPGTAWRGWSFSAGCLWSPEGHAFKPADSAWWSLLCRRSANFGKLYDENRRLQQTLRNASKVQIADQSEVVRQRHAAAQAGALPDVSAAPESGLQGVKELVTLHFSLKNETFRPKPRCLKPHQTRQKAAPCGTLKGTKNGHQGGAK